MRNKYISLITISGLILLWEIGARQGVLSPLYLPEPLEIIRAFRGRLGFGAVVTTSRAIGGYTLGILLAYAGHFLCVRLRLDTHLDAQVTGARAVPVIAVLPLFVIWFGFGEIGRMLVVVLATVSFYIAPLYEAFRVMPRQWSMLRQQVYLSESRYYRDVVIPATLPDLAGSLRVTLAIAFTMAIASDYVGAQSGIGVFLNSARITFNVPAIMCAILVCSCIGVVMDRVLMALYRRFVPWAGKQPKL